MNDKKVMTCYRVRRSCGVPRQDLESFTSELQREIGHPDSILEYRHHSSGGDLMITCNDAAVQSRLRVPQLIHGKWVHFAHRIGKNGTASVFFGPIAATVLPSDLLQFYNGSDPLLVRRLNVAGGVNCNPSSDWYARLYVAAGSPRPRFLRFGDRGKLRFAVGSKDWIVR